jgi:phospholipid-binding lipoprotein MlaA
VRLAAILVLCAATALGCATTSEEPHGTSAVRTMDIEEHRPPTTGESYELLQYVKDPIEPANRVSFRATKGAIDYGVRPAAIGWRFVFPKPVRMSIDHFSYNLEFPDRFVSLLLQGKVVKAGQETGHFVVNTTAGVAGLFDVSQKLGIPTYQEDVGQAFGKWGIGPGFYFFIPLLGPSSGRDAVGKVFDFALSPLTWFPTYGIPWAAFTVNSFSSRIGSYDQMNESGVDLYLPVRTLWAVKRDIEVTDYEIPESAYADAHPAPSLGIMLTRLDDPDFARQDVRREVSTEDTGRKLPYSLWLQEKPAPLVYIIPGIGSHRTATNAVKLAESAFERGYSAVIISNPFNAEFIRFGLSGTYPGYTPADSADLYRAMNAIDADLEKNFPGRVTSSSLMGYSLGGIAALFVSQIERKNADAGALHFERVVAINPAVNLRYAAGLFDEYFNAPIAWPQVERRDRAVDTVKRAWMVGQGYENVEIAKYKTLPFQTDESDFLIGLSSRATTIQAISASRYRGGQQLSLLPPDQLGFQGVFAREVESNTLKRYMDELAIPYYVEKEGNDYTVPQLFAKADLYSQEAGLRDDPRIYVFTNKDDFILQKSDLPWLEKLFAGRITVFPGGGHLGNMYMADVQAAFMQALGAGAAPASEPAAGR